MDLSYHRMEGLEEEVDRVKRQMDGLEEAITSSDSRQSHELPQMDRQSIADISCNSLKNNINKTIDENNGNECNENNQSFSTNTNEIELNSKIKLDNECIDLIKNNKISVTFGEKCDKSMRSTHLREVQLLKSDNHKLRSELNQLRRTKTNVRLKTKKLNKFKSENEKLRNELLITQKLNEILIKIKDYFEEKFQKLLSLNNDLEIDQKLDDLRSEYKKVLNERQTFEKINKTFESKYKLDNDFSNNINNSTNFVDKTTVQSIIAKRPRGRPRKDETVKRLTQTSNLSSSSTPSESEVTLNRRIKSAFKCSWSGCAYQCSRTKMLSEHINSAHTGNRPYSCPMNDCNKSFARSNTLDVHLKSCHSDVRKYKCTWLGCEASLKTKLGLSIHLQRHSGEKQFKCDWPGCSYRGMTKQRLEIHIMNHTGVRPYKCTYFNKTFNKHK